MSFPLEFGIAGETGKDPWIVGIVNAAPYLAASLVGCWLSDPLNNYFGRRGTIFLTALCLIASPIASGFSKSWQALFACRLVLGLGMGTKGSTVPVFAAENSPTVIRGALGRYAGLIHREQKRMKRRTKADMSCLASQSCLGNYGL